MMTSVDSNQLTCLFYSLCVEKRTTFFPKIRPQRQVTPTVECFFWMITNKSLLQSKFG